jgi:hypothetical protein
MTDIASTKCAKAVVDAGIAHASNSRTSRARRRTSSMKSGPSFLVIAVFTVVIRGDVVAMDKSIEPESLLAHYQ